MTETLLTGVASGIASGVVVVWLFVHMSLKHRSVMEHEDVFHRIDTPRVKAVPKR